MRSSRGFTLIEVLVAMAILALSMFALMQTAASQSRNISSLRDRALAEWVAANKLAELQALHSWGSTEKQSGETTMANVNWYWQAEFFEVNDDDLRRVEISVRRNPDSKNPIYRLPGFLASPRVFVSEQSAEES
ncbi:type II secretion system minor pseudopilin GspI [Granulosicoccaceae sp. 1_MG-2023]|nr:type II secretion system minor pseudopilin GspI [Granulosicoccaceae sp. 1_MG-2023]